MEREAQDLRAPLTAGAPVQLVDDGLGRDLQNSMEIERGDFTDHADRARTHEEYAVAEVDVDAGDDDDYVDPSDPTKIKFRWRALWRYTGPGWLMSMAYLDPGNLTHHQVW